MKQNFILSIAFILVFFSSVSLAKSLRYHLSASEVERLSKLKQALSEVDEKTLQQSIAEIEKSPNPPMGIVIKEAMARTYLDIVSQEHVQGLSKKKWLYSMVALNMAYLQFEGDKDNAGNTQNLNKLIRYKLKTYLPSNIFTQPGFHCSLG